MLSLFDMHTTSKCHKSARGGVKPNNIYLTRYNSVRMCVQYRSFIPPETKRMPSRNRYHEKWRRNQTTKPRKRKEGNFVPFLSRRPRDFSSHWPPRTHHPQLCRQNGRWEPATRQNGGEKAEAAALPSISQIPLPVRGSHHTEEPGGGGEELGNEPRGTARATPPRHREGGNPITAEHP